jgi:RimJ/RimL family protein N-acetyltransferase
MSTTPSTQSSAASRFSVAKVVAETERLRLREWEPEDEQAFYEIMNKPAVMRHLGGVQTPEGWNAGFERLCSYQRDWGHTFWIVDDRASHEIQGFCGLKRVNTPGAEKLAGVPEIGWRLRESAWGKGIAKEAAIVSLDLAFGRFDYSLVIAMTIAANAASHGLMERLGMRRRADLDFVDQRFGPEVNPQIVYAITAEEWPAARAAALG